MSLNVSPWRAACATQATVVVVLAMLATVVHTQASAVVRAAHGGAHYQGSPRPLGDTRSIDATHATHREPESSHESTATPSSVHGGKHVGFPWLRVPLKASPGIGRPEVVAGNRTSGVLTDPEVAWLTANHDIVILSGKCNQHAMHPCFFFCFFGPEVGPLPAATSPPIVSGALADVYPALYHAMPYSARHSSHCRVQKQRA